MICSDSCMVVTDEIYPIKPYQPGCCGRENRRSDSSVVAGVCAYRRGAAKVRTAGKSKKCLDFLIVQVKLVGTHYQLKSL